MVPKISRHMIRLMVVIIGIVIVIQTGLAFLTQVAFAQSTPPPRPTPTQGESTPVRNTPTPIDNGTPFRATPTSINVPPPRATSALPPKPAHNPPAATSTPVATPALLPVGGGPGHDDGYQSQSLLILAGLGMACLGMACLAVGFSARRRP